MKFKNFVIFWQKNGVIKYAFYDTIIGRERKRRKLNKKKIIGSIYYLFPEPPKPS